MSQDTLRLAQRLGELAKNGSSFHTTWLDPFTFSTDAFWVGTSVATEPRTR